MGVGFAAVVVAVAVVAGALLGTVVEFLFPLISAIPAFISLIPPCATVVLRSPEAETGILSPSRPATRSPAESAKELIFPLNRIVSRWMENEGRVGDEPDGFAGAVDGFEETAENSERERKVMTSAKYDEFSDNQRRAEAGLMNKE